MLQWVRAAISVVYFATPVNAGAEPPDACLDSITSSKHDQNSQEAFASVKQSADAAVCFLVPRDVLEGVTRLDYPAGTSLRLLPFDPGNLNDYLHAHPTIEVASEERTVEPIDIGCLANPKPVMLAILPNSPIAPNTIESIKGGAKEVSTDLPGYRRYTESGVDYYFVDPDHKKAASFWCHLASGEEVCSIVADMMG